MLYQRTLAKPIKVAGIGIHSGKRVSMVIKPAPADFGIKFKRVDLDNAPDLEAKTALVGATENKTTIGTGENSVHTVEHLLSVLYGFGINNIYCEVDGPEIPIMDGSGASFVFLIKEAGVQNLNKSKKFMVILDTVRVEDGDKWAQIEPASCLTIDSTIVFAHPVIKSQRKVFHFSCENYIKEISRARTFGMLRDVDTLKRKGLIQGGSLDNAVVMDDFKVINNEGLRFEDEFIRHKILDTIGDISLLGHEIAGKITTYKSGHGLHHQLCKKLLATPSAYQSVASSALEQELLDAFALPRAMSPTFN